MAREASRTSTAPGTTGSLHRNKQLKTAFSTRATCCTSSTHNQTSHRTFSLRSVERGNVCLSYETFNVSSLKIDSHLYILYRKNRGKTFLITAGSNACTWKHLKCKKNKFEALILSVKSSYSQLNYVFCSPDLWRSWCQASSQRQDVHRKEWVALILLISFFAIVAVKKCLLILQRLLLKIVMKFAWGGLCAWFLFFCFIFFRKIASLNW